MKIIIVNRNIEHQLSHDIPRVDIIPDSAIIRDGKPFFVPNFSSRWKYEAMVAFRSMRLGKNIAPKFAHRYYDAFTLAVRTIPSYFHLDEKFGTKKGLPSRIIAESGIISTRGISCDN